MPNTKETPTINVINETPAYINDFFAFVSILLLILYPNLIIFSTLHHETQSHFLLMHEWQAILFL